jgi:hypothetical protein
MIAKLFVGGMLLISLYYLIVLYEANIDNSSIRLPMLTKINTNHMRNIDENTKTHGSIRKLARRESSSSNRVDIDDYETLDQTLLSFLSRSAFGRQKVIELMIDKYVSPTTPEDDMADKLDNALEAISFLETDGDPVQVVGYPFLFVGSVGKSIQDFFNGGEPLRVDEQQLLTDLACLDMVCTIIKLYIRRIAQPQVLTRNGYHKRDQLVVHCSVQRL